MIINKNSKKSKTDIVENSAKRLVQQLKLTLVTKDNLITIQEALNDDETIWLDISAGDTDKLEDFIRMCLGYASNIDRLSVGKITIAITCMNCYNCIMTPKQLELNTISKNDNYSIIVCNNCGEIIKIQE